MDIFMIYESSDSSNSSSRESEEIDEVHEFDIHLTNTHSYLQANEFGHVNSFRNFNEPNSILTVPVIVISTVLLPGQTLPLCFEGIRCIDFIRSLSTTSSYFSLITLINSSIFKTSKIGTLFQVRK